MKQMYKREQVVSASVSVSVCVCDCVQVHVCVKECMSECVSELYLCELGSMCVREFVTL